MDITKQIDLYVSNILKQVGLGRDIDEEHMLSIRNTVLLRAFEEVVSKELDDSQKKQVERIIEMEDQEALVSFIKAENLEESIRSQIQPQFIAVVGDVLIEFNKGKIISDEQLDDLTTKLQDPQKVAEIFPEMDQHSV